MFFWNVSRRLCRNCNDCLRNSQLFLYSDNLGGTPADQSVVKKLRSGILLLIYICRYWIVLWAWLWLVSHKDLFGWRCLNRHLPDMRCYRIKASCWTDIRIPCIDPTRLLWHMYMYQGADIFKNGWGSIRSFSIVFFVHVSITAEAVINNRDYYFQKERRTVS